MARDVAEGLPSSRIRLRVVHRVSQLSNSGLSTTCTTRTDICWVCLNKGEKGRTCSSLVRFLEALMVEGSATTKSGDAMRRSHACAQKCPIAVHWPKTPRLRRHERTRATRPFGCAELWALNGRQPAAASRLRCGAGANPPARPQRRAARALLLVCRCPTHCGTSARKRCTRLSHGRAGEVPHALAMRRRGSEPAARPTEVAPAGREGKARGLN